MSFLPHDAPSGVGWYGSMAASALAHAGIVAVMLSGAVAFLPEPVVNELREPEFAVTLEILDADVVEEVDVIDEAGVIPDDAVPLGPDDLTAEGSPEALTALDPDEDALVPEEDALPPDVEAQDPEVLAPEPEVLAPEPEVVDPEPEVVEPEPEVVDPEPEVIAPEPEIAEPEPQVIEPEADVVEPEISAPEPQVIDPEPEVVTPAPEVITPAAPEIAEALPDALPIPVAPVQNDPSPLAIDELSPIDDTVINPLAGGGAAPVAVAPAESDVEYIGEDPEFAQAPQPQVIEQEDLALLVPEPDPVPPVDTGPEPAIVAPDVVEPEAVTPEVVEPEAEDPVAEDPGDAAPAPGDTVIGTEEGTDAQTTVVTRRPLDSPTASDIAIGQLLSRIRDVSQPQCTLALPRRASGDPGAGLSLIGADPQVLDTLATDILSALDFVPVQSREEIDLRQCALLDALRQSGSYPASRIGLAIDNAQLSNGDNLTGRVIGAGGLYITLLVVDDNGVVQDMAPFTSLDGTTPTFEAPVARSGPSRATRQILLALGTPDAPLDIEARLGQLAQDVFAPIPSETLQGMVFGVATFDVR